MGLKKDIRPVTYLKTRSAALLSQVNETHRPVVITQNGEPKAVLQDAESYERMRSALAMLKLLAQGEADYKAGRHVPLREAFARVRGSLRNA
ncbi:MAG: type II toxin-antitoxin system Phd/YefM family antitoxin [Elusimicrobia bacterium]|nr:type II toxin-antitoxin system Phd/YefM family antitoxin [Elusimicrobiota bacterium]